MKQLPGSREIAVPISHFQVVPGEDSAMGLMTVGNEPAVLVLENAAMASHALPGSKMSRLKITIVHKVTLTNKDNNKDKMV